MSGTIGVIWVNKYHSLNANLTKADNDAKGFYKTLDGTIIFEHPNDLACDMDLEQYGKGNPPAGRDDEFAETVDIVFFSGHGSPEGPLFGIDNRDNGVAHYSNMALGHGICKWIVFNACSVLSRDQVTNWEDIFKGLHGILGFDTSCHIAGNRGEKFAENMNRGETIKNAWAMACEETEWGGINWACLFAISSTKNTVEDHWIGKGDFVQGNVNSYDSGFDFHYESGPT